VIVERLAQVGVAVRRNGAPGDDADLLERPKARQERVVDGPVGARVFQASDVPLDGPATRALEVVPPEPAWSHQQLARVELSVENLVPREDVEPPALALVELEQEGTIFPGQREGGRASKEPRGIVDLFREWRERAFVPGERRMHLAKGEPCRLGRWFRPGFVRAITPQRQRRIGDEVGSRILGRFQDRRPALREP